MNHPNNDKISSERLERNACIYVRQSTMRQVRENRASTELQYDLQKRAVELGWPAHRVRVFDGDLGVSGANPGQRSSFTELVAEVGLGRVGIVLSFDATRLARNNADWYRLLDMCGVCQTLVADLDGIYDPALPNDRLVLGMKGAMSEAEHHLIRTRLTQGMLKRAQKGEFRTRLPVGYDYDDDKKVILASDEHVRRAIEIVFDKFDQLGSAHQVHAAFVRQNLLLPYRHPGSSVVTWGPARYPAILSILGNPCYAGAYVYGKTRHVRTVNSDQEIISRQKVLPQAQWKVLIKDHHSRYISWERFEENQKRLDMNTVSFSADEASTILREGAALLQGLLRCGTCGRRMSPSYSKGSVRYTCTGGSAKLNVCMSVGGARLQEAVVEAFLETLSPASMRVTHEALEKLESETDIVLGQLEDRLDEARYQADRARRKFDEVEPGNRKVARILESEWNKRIEDVEDLERQVCERRSHVTAPLTPEERGQLQELGMNLRHIWSAPTTSHRERKQLLQAALEGIFVALESKDNSRRRAHISLVWQGGLKTSLTVSYPRPGQHPVVDESELVDRVREMSASMTDKEIAQTLGRWRKRTTTGKRFTAERVAALRKRHGIPGRLAGSSQSPEKTFTAREAARELGVSLPTVLQWLKEGFLSGEQSGAYAPWRIRIPESVRVQSTTLPPRGWLPLTEAASALGLTRSEVLRGIRGGQLQAVLAGVGRRRGLRIKVDRIAIEQPTLL